MGIRRSVLVGLLVFVGVVLVAAPALGLEASVLTTTDENEMDESGEFGEQVSSFAQSSAVDANESIDSGMWEQSLNATDDRDRSVEVRFGAIEDRIERLEAQRDELEADRAESGLNEQAYQARASALQTQIQNLDRSVNHTSETAERHGVAVNQSTLETLRNNASNMTGPEVSALARNITDAPRGPPADAGPPDHAEADGDDDESNAEDRGPGNDTDRGPPDHAGPDDDSDQSDE